MGRVTVSAAAPSMKAASRPEMGGRREGARALGTGWAHCPPLPEGGLGGAQDERC